MMSMKEYKTQIIMIIIQKQKSYRKQMEVDGKVGMLDMLDTTGQEEFTVLRDQWISDCEGFLLVYSITSRRSFEQVKLFHDYIYQVKEGQGEVSEFLPIVIIGNKSDLIEDRMIQMTEGMKMSKEFQCEFLECSAKTRENVEEAFCQLVRSIREYRGESPSSSSRRRSTSEPSHHNQSGHNKHSNLQLKSSHPAPRKFCNLL